MMAMLRALAIASMLLAICAAQTARGVFTYEKETVLSGAAETVTVHLATGANRTVRFVGATVYCSVACTVTLYRDGGAPSQTAATVVPLNTESPVATVWHTSDVTGTALKKYTLSAGEEKLIDLSDKGLIAGKNLTLQTSSITGTARVYFQWREF